MTEPVAVESAPPRDPEGPAAPPGVGSAGAMPTTKGVDSVGDSGPVATATEAATTTTAAAGTAQDEPHVSWQDIKSVQNLIERCLQKFMTQTEIIAALQVSGQAEINGYTSSR